MISLENMNVKVIFILNLFRNYIFVVEVCGIEFYIRKGFLSWKFFFILIVLNQKIIYIDFYCMGQILFLQRERFIFYDYLLKNGKQCIIGVKKKKE